MTAAQDAPEAPPGQINTFWFGGALSWIAHAGVRSFLRNGHAVRIFSYRPLENVPDGAETADANEVLPEDKIFRYEGVSQPAQIGSLAPYSDYFRYTLMKKGFGAWADADMYCFQPVDLTSDYVLGWENDRTVGNAIMKLPLSSPLLNELVDAMEPPYEIPFWTPPAVREQALEKLNGRPFHPGALTYAAYGPIAVTMICQKHDLDFHAKPEAVYYPVHFARALEMADPEFDPAERFGPETRTVHLWHSRLGPFHETEPPKGTFLNQIWREGHGG